MKFSDGIATHLKFRSSVGYAETETKLLDVLEIVLERCEEFSVKLHPKMCCFLSFETVWCRKNMSGNGLSHCADRIQGFM